MTRWELELEVGVARGLANKLRAKHLEEHDLQGKPVAFADSSGITEKLKAGRLRLDTRLSASLGARQGEQAAMILQQRLGQDESSKKPSAPPPSPPGQGDSLEGAWPLGSQVNWRTSRGSGRPGKNTSDASITASPRRCLWEAYGRSAWPVY